MVDWVRYHFQNVQTTSDEMHGFIEFLLQLETLNMQKQTDCIILIHFLYIFSILSLYTNNWIFLVNRNPRIKWERNLSLFTYTVQPRVCNTDLYGGECLTLSMACTNTLCKVHLSSNQHLYWGIENCWLVLLKKVKPLFWNKAEVLL